jgi:hypothetical protein
MKGGTRTALALGAGYVLGRRRKMRLATLLAIGAATGGIGGVADAAVRRGIKALASTELLGRIAPQIGEIADTVRCDLLEAGKAAAVAAASDRIESLTDSLHERTQRIREPAEAVTEQAVRRVPRQRGRDLDSGEDAGASRGEAQGPEDSQRPIAREADENGRKAAPGRRRPVQRRPAAARIRR